MGVALGIQVAGRGLVLKGRARGDVRTIHVPISPSPQGGTMHFGHAIGDEKHRSDSERGMTGLPGFAWGENNLPFAEVVAEGRYLQPIEVFQCSDDRDSAIHRG